MGSCCTCASLTTSMTTMAWKTTALTLLVLVSIRMHVQGCLTSMQHILQGILQTIQIRGTAALHGILVWCRVQIHPYVYQSFLTKPTSR